MDPIGHQKGDFLLVLGHGVGASHARILLHLRARDVVSWIPSQSNDSAGCLSDLAGL